MRIHRFAMAACAITFASTGAQATTVIVFIDPMTFEKHTHVYDTPGRDRFLMCVEPPGTAGCTEIPIRKKGR